MLQTDVTPRSGRIPLTMRDHERFIGVEIVLIDKR
jgi:hypothetical protein